MCKLDIANSIHFECRKDIQVEEEEVSTKIEAITGTTIEGITTIQGVVSINIINITETIITKIVVEGIIITIVEMAKVEITRILMVQMLRG